MTSASNVISRLVFGHGPEGLKGRVLSFFASFKTPEAVSVIIAENNRIRASSRHWQL